MSQSFQSLCSGFITSCERFPERPALEINGIELSYKYLKERSASLAASIIRFQPDNVPKLTAVFAYRSIEAYSGVLAALMSGHGYVPLNMTFPSERSKAMLARSGARSIILDETSAGQLDAVLYGVSETMLLIFPEIDDVSGYSARWPQHKIIGKGGLEPAESWKMPLPDRDSVAYLLFTSGSTGTPKGVAIAHRNVIHYVNFIVNRYSVTENDRFSQTFDMTFDLSVADMFVAWERGACLCSPSQKALIKPGNYITQSKLTIWFSVPSTGVFMKRLGVLKPGMYPGLRVSMFCGEALPVEVARAWSEAAPNSIVENLYGPTELTIACSCYRWDANRTPGESEIGVVPIGAPFPGMSEIIVDENLKAVHDGNDGELLMTGPQLSLGYWQDAPRTASAFVVPPDESRVFYRTGDRVRKRSAGGPLLYLGRMDNQIKIHGHRVELGEVEAVLREVSGIDAVVAVGWPINAGGAGGVEAFMQSGLALDTHELLRKVGDRLPSYMVPRKLHAVESFPLNSNGKFDRKALVGLLEKSK